MFAAGKPGAGHAGSAAGTQQLPSAAAPAPARHPQRTVGHWQVLFGPQTRRKLPGPAAAAAAATTATTEAATAAAADAVAAPPQCALHRDAPVRPLSNGHPLYFHTATRKWRQKKSEKY